MASLLLPDEVVMLALSDDAMGRYSVGCEVVEMRVTTSESEVMILCLIMVDSFL